MRNSDQRRRLILTLYLIAVASILAIDRLTMPAPAPASELIFISDTDSIDVSRQSNSVYRIGVDGSRAGLGSGSAALSRTRREGRADAYPAMKRVVGSIPHGDGYLLIAAIDCHGASQSLVIASQRRDLNGFHHALLDGSGLHLDRPAAGQLLTSLRHIALAPDGQSVIVSRQYEGFTAPRYGLVAGDLGSREYRAIKTPTANRSYHSPEWSPDGRQIAYIIAEFRADAPTSNRLVLAAPDGGDERIIYQTPLALDDVAWSPNGEWLALEVSRQIYKLRPDGSDLTRLSGLQMGASSPRWSPTGERLSVVAPSSFPGFKQILALDADGRNIQQVANIRGDVLNGCWA